MGAAGDAHVTDGKSATEFQEFCRGGQTFRFWFAQEIDGQARRDSQRHPADVGQHHHPGGSVGQGHHGRTRDGAPRPDGYRLGGYLHAGVVRPHVGHHVGTTLGERLEQVGVDLVGGHHRDAGWGHDSGTTGLKFDHASSFQPASLRRNVPSRLASLVRTEAPSMVSVMATLKRTVNAGPSW